MKKIRIPLRLMARVREERALWVLDGEPPIEVGDRVGLQHPRCFLNGPVYQVVVVTSVSLPEQGCRRVEFRPC